MCVMKQIKGYTLFSHKRKDIMTELQILLITQILYNTTAKLEVICWKSDLKRITKLKKINTE
jgi:hypothetical protein